MRTRLLRSSILAIAAVATFPAWSAATLPVFSGQTDYLVSPPLAGLRAAELNGAPGTDLLCIGSHLVAMTSDGAGALTPVTIATSQTGFGTVVVSDFDEDGDQDVLAGTFPAQLFRNDGAGNFQVQSLGSFAVQGLAVVDVDGLHAGDIATSVAGYAPPNDGDLRIYLRNTDGTVSLSPNRPVFANGTPKFLAEADVDLDGHGDVVGAGTGTLHVLRGDGSALGAPVTYDGPANPGQILVGRVDGDAAPDVLVSDPDHFRVWLYRNAVDGTFPPHEEIVGTHVPTRIALADLDDDGDLDLVIGSETGDAILMRENDGAGHFGPEELLATVGTGLQDFVLFDVDGDGDLDLAVTTQSTRPGNVHVILNRTESLAAGRPAVAFALSAAPIPFHDRARITLQLPAAAPARVAVYDVGGRQVRELWNGLAVGGRHDLAWDGVDDAGHVVGAGVYLVRAVTAQGARTLRLARVR